MATNRIMGMMERPQESAAGQDDYRPTRHESGGWSGLVWPIIGLSAVALVVLGGIYVLPDVVRYMKMRSM